MSFLAIEAGESYEEADIISWSGQASSGLLYLHRNNILHGNLTPGKYTRVIIFRPRQFRMFLSASKKTLKIGGLRGSMKSNDDFLAPEVREGQDNSKESDVFSLGKSIEWMDHRRSGIVVSDYLFSGLSSWQLFLLQTIL